MVKTPWFLSRTAGDCPIASTTCVPIASSPTYANPPHGIAPPNSSAMAVRYDGMGRPIAAKAVA